MNDEELKLSEEAFWWIKTNRKKVIQKFADTAEYSADALPTTLIMRSKTTSMSFWTELSLIMAL